MENFKEVHLPESFNLEFSKKVRQLILEGQSFTVLGMDSVGVSPFLKYIASQSYASFIHIDMYELAKFTKEEFLGVFYYKLTHKKKENVSFDDCKDVILKMLQDLNRIVVIINKFDLLEKDFSQAFFGNFRTLCHGTDGRLSLIFSATQPYIEYNPQAIHGSNMHIFSRYLYFKPYSPEDLKELIMLHSPEYLNSERLPKAILQSGGHIQLLQLILRSEMPQNLENDPYINLLFKTILNQLSHEKRRVVQKIALGKRVEHDAYLENIGVVKTVEKRAQLFSELFTKYIIQKKNSHLPPKERLLFQLLKNAKGKIISKEKIFQIVWSSDQENATDWALDAVLYRLRRNSTLKEKGYIIKNIKKLGYQLIKE